MKQRYCMFAGTFVAWFFLLLNSMGASAHGFEQFLELAPGEESVWSEHTLSGRIDQKIMVTYEIHGAGQQGIMVSLMERRSSSSPVAWNNRDVVEIPAGSSVGSMVFTLPIGADFPHDEFPYKIRVTCLDDGGVIRDNCSASVSHFLVQKPIIESFSCTVGQLGYGAPCRVTLEDEDERVDTTVEWYQFGSHRDWLGDGTFAIVACAEVTVKVINMAGTATATTTPACRF